MESWLNDLLKVFDNFSSALKNRHDFDATKKIISNLLKMDKNF